MTTVHLTGLHSRITFKPHQMSPSPVILTGSCGMQWVRNISSVGTIGRDKVKSSLSNCPPMTDAVPVGSTDQDEDDGDGNDGRYYRRPIPATMRVQAVRSVSDWSHGVLTEHSIQNACERRWRLMVHQC